MRRSQVSFEFILLFTLALFAFVMTLTLLPDWLEKSKTTQNTAQKLANEVKILAITASLSRSDFESTIEIPKNINEASVEVEVFQSDRLLLIKEGDTVLARSFLPKIDTLTGTGNTLRITKQNGILTMELS